MTAFHVRVLHVCIIFFFSYFNSLSKFLLLFFLPLILGDAQDQGKCDPDEKFEKKKTPVFQVPGVSIQRS